MRQPLPLCVALLAVVPLACQSLPTSLNPYPPQFTRAMAAAEKVLARHFVVTGIDKAHGVVGASSVVRANAFTKYRTRAQATVFPVGQRTYDVQIRVTNELEMSEPSLLGRGQPAYDWRAVGFDHVLEAALMTELQAELQGQSVSAVPPGYSGFLKPSPPKLRHRDLFKPPIPDPAPKPPPPPQSLAPRPNTQAAAQAPKTAPKALYHQYLALGDVYERQREHKKALLEYQRAALARADAPAPHLALASVLTALNRYDAAAAALRDAAKAAPKATVDPSDIGRLRGAAADLSDRLLALKGWLKQNPRDNDAHLVLGYHFLLADRADEARKTLSYVRQTNPADPGAQFLLRQVDAPKS